MSYTHHISLNGSDYTQVYPTNPIQIETVQEPDCIFMRDHVSLVKLNYDDNSAIYTSLESYFDDNTKFNVQIEYEIYQGARAGDPFYKALFSISDCEIDKEKKFIEIEPRTNDVYREVLDHWQDSYNSGFAADVGMPEEITITWVAGSPNASVDDCDTFTEGATANIISSLINASGVPSDPQTRHCDIGNVTTVGRDDIVVAYVKAYTKNSGSDLEMRVYNAADADITNENSVTITDTGHYALSIKTAASPGYFLLYAPDLFNGSITLEVWLVDSDNLTVDACDKFTTVIDNYLTGPQLMNLSISTVSTFFNNDALPSDAPSTIDTWITSNPDGNYVTEQTGNRLTYFMIGFGEEWETTGQWPKTDLKTILAAIRDTLQVYWYIDADGDFRIEHRMYFDSLVADSTAIDLSDYSEFKPEVDASRLAYNKSLIYSREEFSTAQKTADTDFIGKPIIYDIFETANNVKKHNQNITADIDYMLSDGVKSGLCIYDCFYADGLDVPRHIIKMSVGVLTDVNKANGYLSWANLHSNYWSWGRMSENANINGSDATMDSIEMFLEQEDIRFHYDTAIDWYNKITATQGTGRILNMIRDLDSDFITFKLGFNPYE